MRFIHHFLLMVSAMVVLVGCQTIVHTPATTKVDVFSPIMLNARRLEIIDNWQMPIKAPFIGHHAQILPSNLLGEWASKVLSPAGGSGELVFDIKRASVTRTALPLKVGIENLFQDQQESKIKVEFDVQIMWLQPVGGSQALVKLQADHSVTIPESASTSDFKNAIQLALNGALESLDQQTRSELAKVNSIILP